MLHILYFVHDLADPAVRRRVLMLQAGGARVTLAGFRRDDNALAAVHGVEPIELGRTRDAQFTHRIAAVAKSALKLRGSLHSVQKPDVIIGRNLEMLALAKRARHLRRRYARCLRVSRYPPAAAAQGHAWRRPSRRGALFWRGCRAAAHQLTCLRRTLFPPPFRPRSADRSAGKQGSGA